MERNLVSVVKDEAIVLNALRRAALVPVDAKSIADARLNWGRRRPG